MASRTPQKFLVALYAAIQQVKFSLQQRTRPKNPQRILIAHHLRLGDLFMLTPLLAKTRAQYPNAEICLITPEGFASLYQHKPFAIDVLPYNPYRISSFFRLYQQRGFDLAFIPGDNRYAWLARALASRWVVAFAGDRPAYKNWPIDELIPFPQTPIAWGDMNTLLVPGPMPIPYRITDWHAPDKETYISPNQPYCVFHPGASTPLKEWPDQKWRTLIDYMKNKNIDVVWTGMSSEQTLIDRINTNIDHKTISYAGKLSLPQLWDLIKNAKLLVSVDTSIAHLGRIIGTPTIALFGPGSALISGAGEYWRNSPFWPVTVKEIHCRNQATLFKREATWIKRCARSTSECHNNICMQKIDVGTVTSAIEMAVGK